jgi:hypothetical protein
MSINPCRGDEARHHGRGRDAIETAFAIFHPTCYLERKSALRSVLEGPNLLGIDIDPARGSFAI